MRQSPYATLDELQVQLAVGGPVRSQSALGRAVQALDWRQKKSFHAAERDTGRVKMRRKTFVEAVQKEEVTLFNFVDETITNLPYCRCYDHAEGGQRVGHGVCRYTVGRT